MQPDWQCIQRKRWGVITTLNKIETKNHPLKPPSVTILENQKLSNKSDSFRIESTLDPLIVAFDGIDPLSQFISEKVHDPLSLAVGDVETAEVASESIPVSHNLWKTKKSMVLNKFTTSEKLTITTSFLTGGEIIKATTVASEKFKYRLEQLDEFDDGSVKQMINLSQQEYVIKIEQLNQNLIQAWHSDQRVNALKIAIQCSKLLADTTAIQFYPSKFVLVTDILDTFGRLVYERLNSKSDAFDTMKDLETYDSARETCLNWFYKIASIRELLPRIYIEMSILKSYKFLPNTNLVNSILRINKMIRGIGDPLVSVYTRCYLCRVGLNLTSNLDYIKSLIEEFLEIYHSIFSSETVKLYSQQNIDTDSYLSLYTPAVDWIFQVVSLNTSTELLEDILILCLQKDNNGLLLNSIITTFPNKFITHHVIKLISIISNTAYNTTTKCQLFGSLGSSLNSSHFTFEQKINLKKYVWTFITSIEHPLEYASSIDSWSLFIAKYFDDQDIDLLLQNIIMFVSANKITVSEIIYERLQSIIEKILVNYKDLEKLLFLNNFLPYLDLFKKDLFKLNICKTIMVNFKVKYSNDDSSTKMISDAVLVNTIMYICKLLCDSINALSVDDERRHISILINNFIRLVKYGFDYEKQLSFYVECRASFQNLDMVLENLVHQVNTLSMNLSQSLKKVKNNSFVRSCAAYCFITIPSIVSVMSRMNLYLLSGRVALANLCLGQADAFFEAGVNSILEIPKVLEVDGLNISTESYLVSYINNLLSTLICVPDSPEKGVLYLTTLLLENVKKYSSNLSLNGQTLIYLHTLDMLSISAQITYPYHIRNIISNDELYGADPKFIAEINKICSKLVKQILTNLSAIDDQKVIKYNLSYELFIRIITQADLNNENIFALAISLWNFIANDKDSHTQLSLVKTYQSIKGRYDKNKNLQQFHIYKDLLQQMKRKI